MIILFLKEFGSFNSGLLKNNIYSLKIIKYINLEEAWNNGNKLLSKNKMRQKNRNLCKDGLRLFKLIRKTLISYQEWLYKEN